jgi:chaperonin GroEL (HSP60 family)
MSGSGLGRWGRPRARDRDRGRGTRIRSISDTSSANTLAVEAFADALEVVPRTLAENARLDPIDSLVALRARYADGATAAGLDAYSGEVSDMFDLQVVEPLGVRRRAVDGAAEVVELVLRIDDVIAAGPLDD